MQPRGRTGIDDFEPYSPGLSIEEIKHRYGLSQVIKMASNENPLGTSPVVRKALERSAAMAFRYPRAGSPSLRRTLAEHHNVDAANVVAGNGSDELIDLLIRVLAEPGRDNIVAFNPCFSIYTLQAKLCGVEFRQVELGRNFTFPWEELRARVDNDTALVFLTTPDNPSGYAPPVEEVESFARSLPERTTLVVDEAYMEFAVPLHGFSLLPRFREFSNLVILRTFSKMYGLAGLRLGYGIMPHWIGDLLLRVKLPFSVNILAEAAGKAALGDLPFFEATLKTVVEGRQFLSEALQGMGCTVYPTQANFLMLRPPQDATTLFQALLERGIIIRHLGSYGMPD
ncbi:MAG: histidinol-phosphate transaminase, partial [bacterium]